MLGDAVAGAFRPNGVDAQVAGGDFVGAFNRIERTASGLLDEAGEVSLAGGRVGEAFGACGERGLVLRRGGEEKKRNGEKDAHGGRFRPGA